jgi:hypothetical protein
MSVSITQVLAKQELVLAFVAEGAEDWIESEKEELEADDRIQSKEEEDARAASASAPFDANAAFVADELIVTAGTAGVDGATGDDHSGGLAPCMIHFTHVGGDAGGWRRRWSP